MNTLIPSMGAALRARADRVVVGVLLGLSALLGSALPAWAGDLPSLGQQVSVRFSGYTYARTAGTYNTVATLSNTSQTAFVGSLRLVLGSISPATASLANATGTGSDGKPYLEIAPTGGGLPPGASVSATLAFRNPSGQAIRFVHHVQGVPASFPGGITLELGAAAVAPGQAFDVQWASAGDLPAGAAVQLRALAPRVDAAAPNTVAWYRTAAGAWSTEQEALQATAGRGKLRMTLPTPAHGSWRIEARLVDARGSVLVGALRTLAVADKPSLLLQLSRSIANSADPVRASVTLAAGTTPQPVRLMAWLVGPDGSTFGLPGFERTQLEVYRGASSNLSFTLLDRAFAGSELGAYRVHVGLYDGNGGLLASDSRRFEVCDTRASLSGVVRDAAGTAVNGTLLTAVTVSAIDLDEGATTASAATISAAGGFEMLVPPGRYALQTKVIGTGSVRRGVAGPVTVGCSGAPVAQDLALSTP